MGVLDAHCERLGRDPAEICRTRLGTIAVGRTREDAERRALARTGATRLEDLPADMQSRLRSMFIMGDPDDVASQVHELLEAGLDGLVVNLPDAHDVEQVALAGEVLGSVLLHR
jgi:alkanesulfonate monooxygenase SsuD/methylene tetrahydromethanopterin reductase-like flavin-dependent oxidoreductase (luciferase family)